MVYEKIDNRVIETILRSHDIVDTVGKYVQLTKHGKYMKGLCPFHSEKTPSFTVTPEKQIFYCYGCGKGGNSIKFIEEIEELSFPEAIRQMAQEAGIVVQWNQSNANSSAEDVERAKLLEAHELTAKLYHYVLMNTPQGQQPLAYLRSRGLTEKLIDQFMIGYAPAEWDTLSKWLEKRGYDLAMMERGGLLAARQDASGYFDRFRDRIMFPIHNRDGKTIAFAARALGDATPKYLNSPETKLFSKSRQLYHFDEAKTDIRKQRKVILFEGYMDVIKAWHAGVHNGVASMGTALTAEHVTLLQRNCDEAIICYDGDRAGIAAAFKAIPLLEQQKMRVKVAMIPGGQDPDEYIERHGVEMFRREVIDQAVSAVKYKLLMTKRNYQLQDNDGLSAYLNEASRIIADLPSPVERDLYMKELAREFDISLEAFKQDVHTYREKTFKLQAKRDNTDIWWNNGRQENRQSNLERLATRLLPAYQVAERRLLARMIQDAEFTTLIQQKLGDQFFEEDHAAIAAYLYAYYAQGHGPDAGRFIASLNDERLERTAALIVTDDDQAPLDDQALEDCVKQIMKMPLNVEIEKLREQFIRAERAGDVMLAAKIGKEMSALERQIKQR